MATVYSKQCLECGKHFFTKAPQAKFCSRLCGSRSRSKDLKPDDPLAIIKTCKYCKEEFTVKLAYENRLIKTKGFGQIYCSMKCHAAQRSLDQKPTIKHLQCPECNQDFIPSKSTSRYCSRKCAGHANRRYSKTDPSQRLTHTCLMCNKEYPIPTWREKTHKKINTYGRAFCGKICYELWVKTAPKKEKKICNRCNRTFPHTQEFFGPRNRGGKFRLEHYCRECTSEVAGINSKRYRQKAKSEIIHHYSKGTNTCACCGESHIEFLTLDHIEGGGTRERLILPGNIYTRLRNQGFPPGYRILCFNCNWCYGHYNYCPHQREKDHESTNESPTKE